MDRNQRASSLASEHKCGGNKSKNFMKTVMKSKIGRKVRDSLTITRQKRDAVYRRAGRSSGNIGNTMPSIQEEEEEEEKNEETNKRLSKSSSAVSKSSKSEEKSWTQYLLDLLLITALQQGFWQLLGYKANKLS